MPTCVLGNFPLILFLSFSSDQVSIKLIKSNPFKYFQKYSSLLTLRHSEIIVSSYTYFPLLLFQLPFLFRFSLFFHLPFLQRTPSTYLSWIIQNFSRLHCYSLYLPLLSPPSLSSSSLSISVYTFYIS